MLAGHSVMKDISDRHGKKKGKENCLNLLLKSRTEEDHLFEMGTGGWVLVAVPG